jgi:hypothetical protein
MSQPDRPTQRQIGEAQELLALQKRLLRRSIVQGTLTQAGEDQLRNLEQALARMKEQARPARTSEIQPIRGQWSRLVPYLSTRHLQRFWRNRSECEGHLSTREPWPKFPPPKGGIK